MIQPIGDYSVQLYEDPHAPKTIRVGDYNSDGYPDFLLSVVDLSGIQSTYIFLNECADEEDCTERKFNTLQNQYQIEVENSYLATFFDLREDG